MHESEHCMEAHTCTEDVTRGGGWSVHGLHLVPSVDGVHGEQQDACGPTAWVGTGQAGKLCVVGTVRRWL